jgi:hypothetical protein
MNPPKLTIYISRSISMKDKSYKLMIDHPQMSFQNTMNQFNPMRIKAQNITHLKDIMGRTSQIITCRVDQEWGM